MPKLDRNQALITAANLRFDVKRFVLKPLKISKGWWFVATFYEVDREPLESTLDWDDFLPEMTLGEVLDRLLGEEEINHSTRVRQLLDQREKIHGLVIKDLA